MVEYIGDDEIRVKKGIFIGVDPIDVAIGESMRRAEVLNIAVNEWLSAVWVSELLGRTANLHYRII